jgi:hypothetical protein
MSCKAVACFPPSAEAGYATPAAMVFSLALALAASALVARSVTLLRLTKSDLERTDTEYALSGAQLQSAAAIVRTGQPGPFHWVSSTDLGSVDILVERESNKLSLKSAAGLAPEVLARFGVADAPALQARLAAAADQPDAVDVAALDVAPQWRVCAPRLVSTFGEQDRFAFVADAEPVVGDKPAWWRIGEVWRIRTTTAAGWRDDRIVRFTGDASHPVAIVARWFARREGDGGGCEEILQAAAA